MEYFVEQYRQWLRDNIALTNAFSEESLRQMSIQMLLGNNYRLITENNTKSKLTLTYLWLTDVIDNAKNEFGDNWKNALVEDLSNIRHRTPEQNNLLFWLAGLTQKTSTVYRQFTYKYKSIRGYGYGMAPDDGRVRHIEYTWFRQIQSRENVGGRFDSFDFECLRSYGK